MILSYTDAVAETTANQIGVWTKNWRTTALCGFFTSVCHSVPSSMAGPVAGESSDSLAPSSPVRQPRYMCPVTTIGVAARVLKHELEAAIMRQAPAHPQQPQQQSVLEIIAQALRAAATAPTVFDALDLTGAALLSIADLMKNEVTA
jgi:hypothetical protein